MDFMNLLKSLENLLFELVSWLIFYPMTMWRSVVKPLEMMRYADLELGDRADRQYDDTVNPPLFLLITLMISQGISAAVPSVSPAEGAAPLAAGTNLLIARGVLFSAFPLVMAVSLLRRKSVRLTRDTLRPPFYSQCYAAAPFALMVAVSADLMFLPIEGGMTLGLSVLALATFWYLQAEVRWFRRDLQIGAPHAVWLVLRGFCIAVAVFFAIALALAWELRALAH